MLPNPKAVAEWLLLRTGVAAISRRKRRGRALVLAYHNVVPDDETPRGDVSLHIPRRRFAEHLDVLAESGAEVLPLEEVMRSTREGNLEGQAPRVVITFDDAYAGAVDLGVQELVQRGFPATIFVVPGLLGGQTFWWDALSASGGGLRRDVRREALVVARGRNDEVLAWAGRQGLPTFEVPEYMRSAGSNETLVAAGREGIELGSHSWSHANLVRLSPEECRVELDRAAGWLYEHLGKGPGWLSYPYGLHCVEAERATAATGHRGAFRVEGGWLPSILSTGDMFQLPRLNIPAGLSRDGLALRLAGLLSD